MNKIYVPEHLILAIQALPAILSESTTVEDLKHFNRLVNLSLENLPSLFGVYSSLTEKQSKILLHKLMEDLKNDSYGDKITSSNLLATRLLTQKCEQDIPGLIKDLLSTVAEDKKREKFLIL